MSWESLRVGMSLLEECMGIWRISWIYQRGFPGEHPTLDCHTFGVQGASQKVSQFSSGKLLPMVIATSSMCRRISKGNIFFPLGSTLSVFDCQLPHQHISKSAILLNVEAASLFLVSWTCLGSHWQRRQSLHIWNQAELTASNDQTNSSVAKFAAYWSQAKLPTGKLRLTGKLSFQLSDRNREATGTARSNNRHCPLKQPAKHPTLRTDPKLPLGTEIEKLTAETHENRTLAKTQLRMDP